MAAADRPPKKVCRRCWTDGQPCSTQRENAGTYTERSDSSSCCCRTHARRHGVDNALLFSLLRNRGSSPSLSLLSSAHANEQSVRNVHFENTTSALGLSHKRMDVWPSASVRYDQAARIEICRWQMAAASAQVSCPREVVAAFF